ncbi:uncharacterized protein TNCV_1996091 [Trichonephila clavipes]|uniref:Uncharacterized protein n=1 Tax=Trichonephila clavipes TaxID=2585209 RepID=A0A8X6RPX0_TRICX|nr:uncharacterized protein TNCV_1996091 [Trichonephila clavipes]
MGLNLGEGTDVCKRLLPLWQVGTLNIYRTASSLERLVEGEERWEAPDHPKGIFCQIWDRNVSKRIVTCMVLKDMAKLRLQAYKLAICHDEFHGPRSGICRLDAISNNNKKTQTFIKTASSHLKLSKRMTDCLF